MTRCWFARLLALTLLAGGGCASGNSKYWRDPMGRLVAPGPMVGPYDSLTKLGPALCGLIKELPGAVAGHERAGQEYCGLIYQRNSEAAFYATHPSSLSSPTSLAGRRKNCYPVEVVSDPDAKSINIYADYHSHPGVSSFSEDDLKLKNQPYYFRVQFNPICEVYLYELQTRTVFQLLGDEFVPIRQVANDDLGY